jgi:hypothetical protein
VVNYENQKLSWQPIKNSAGYKIFANGKLIKTIATTSLQVKPDGYKEYQVIAVDKNKVESFASEPVAIVNQKYVQVFPAEDFADKSNLPYKGFTGDGFIEISKTVNKIVKFKVTIAADGLYSFDFRYANGNGPVNTENKCAIRTLSVDEKPVNAVIFPQRGKEEWSNWGYSNSLKTVLTKDNHTISISLENTNENMNGEINQAMIDFMRVQYLK